MSQETDALLRIILFNSMMAESQAEVIRSIRVMCSKDMVAAVEKEVEEAKEEKKNQAK